MTVRRKITVYLALIALLFGAGCGGGDGLTLSVETEDTLYQESQRLKKLGRNSEALSNLLKLIERRGEQASPESHLDAGLIYLENIKDPVEAIHHFKKYLYLSPNSTKTALVGQRIDLARRELFRSMPGRPNDEQAARFGGMEAIERLQRENDELRAELGRQKGSVPAQMFRTTRGPVEAADPAPAPLAATSGTLKMAPMPPSFEAPPAMPPTTNAQFFGGRPTPTTKQVSTPTRPGGPAPVAGKRHKVAAGEGLYRIGLKYGVKAEAIAAVNRDVLPNGVNSKLSPGMELKIP